jgi:1-phosphofructokinase
MRRLPITTITLHAAMDMILDVPLLALHEVQESRTATLVPSGKGVNVARCLSCIGDDVYSLVLAGDDFDSSFRQLGDEHVTVSTIRSGSTTRINVTIRDRIGTTHIRSHSKISIGNAITQILNGLDYIGPGPFFCILSGSIPEGIEVAEFRRLLIGLKDRGHTVAVDSSGVGLRTATEVGVHIVKPNLNELSELIGWTPSNEAELVDAGRTLQTMGTDRVLVSLGDRGAVLIAEDSAWVAKGEPAIAPVGRIGAGDALLGGYVSSFVAGESAPDNLESSIAAASASLLSEIPGFFERAAYLANRLEFRGSCLEVGSVA